MKSLEAFELERLRQAKQHEMIRHEAFVHGFIAARDPKTAGATLLLCVEADAAYVTWRQSREL